MGAARRERGEVTRTGDRWKRGEAEARAGCARACPVSRDALETRRDAMAVGRGDATRTSAASGPPLYTMVSSRRKDETGSGRFSTCGEAGGALGAGAGSSGRASHGAELREHGGSARACVRAARGSGRFDKPEEPSVFSSCARTRRTSIAPASRLKRRHWWRHLWTRSRQNARLSEVARAEEKGTSVRAGSRRRRDVRRGGHLRGVV